MALGSRWYVNKNVTPPATFAGHDFLALADCCTNESTFLLKVEVLSLNFKASCMYCRALLFML